MARETGPAASVPAFAPASAPMPVEGDPAPPLDLPSQDGSRVRLSDFKGRPVVVFFVPKAATPG